ncbi:neuropeptide FF receptor 1 like 2 [Syngnathoides biaculeatus]|uniref:neuropeptide FF receptor 1 like 2 n=1 Tax=Syngnathoides biaculeatus TaxID=300417 RepID=UPI002ADE6BEF|nr:neuropeptide FF receptor 1 like 2 [Syngnathoides biaculeatus]XP_061674185.1 neuropeptide FF receptor 1 like 2 [Syngnathoides biaculeatus]
MEMLVNLQDELLEMETGLDNTSSNTTLKEPMNMTLFPYYQHSVYVATSYILAYFFIFLLCMVGNMLVCLIVLGNHHMRTVTNLFILNLAISDLLVGIFCIPTTLVDNLITGWPFSNVVCKMSGFVQGVSVSASVFTLVAIAVERFRCIVYLHNKSTIVTAKAAIGFIWILAMVIMCPAAVALTVEEVPLHYMVYNDDLNHTLPLYTCYENFANPKMTKVYTAVLFAHIYMIPLIIITLMYGNIGAKLCSSGVANRMSQETNIQARSRRRGKPVFSQKKIQAIKMLILVTLLFMLSWLPLWTVMMMADYAGLERDQLDLLTSYIFPFAHWLAFANSSINPIIYGYYNENFKRGFQVVSNFRIFSSLMQWPIWRRMTTCLRRGRSVQVSFEGSNCRNDGGNNNQLLFAVRNRDHNDKVNTDKFELNRSHRVRSMAVHSGRSVLHQEIEMGMMKKKVSHIDDVGKASPLSVSLNQAWDN